MSVTARTAWKPRQLSEYYGCKVDNVLSWIGNGRLRALDVSANPGQGKPRWVILDADRLAFEAEVAAGRPEPRVNRRKARKRERSFFQ